MGLERPMQAQSRTFDNRSSFSEFLLACPRKSSPNACKTWWSGSLSNTSPSHSTTARFSARDSFGNAALQDGPMATKTDIGKTFLCMSSIECRVPCLQMLACVRHRRVALCWRTLQRGAALRLIPAASSSSRRVNPCLLYAFDAVLDVEACQFSFHSLWCGLLLST